MNNANDNHIGQIVTRSGKTVTYRNIADRDHKRGGRVTAGRVTAGQHAAVTPGQSVVLWGVDRNCVSRFRPYRIEFKIGDTAEYDSYNLSYTGTITAIGEKTITIESNGRTYRLSLFDFNWRNNDFDARAIEARNHVQMQAI